MLPLVLVACAGLPPEALRDPVATGAWRCEDATWAYEDVVVADTCDGDTGERWLTERSELRCENHARFEWRIGYAILDCAVSGASLACEERRVETLSDRVEVHEHRLEGTFTTRTTAEGAWTWDREVRHGEEADRCTVRFAFGAERLE